MNIKELMFLKAAAGPKEECLLPIAFSATGINSYPGTYNLTNNYGTTIDSTSATDNSVTVTQVPNHDYQSISYRNGYVDIVFEKLPDWYPGNIAFSADIEITANPLEVDKMQAIVTTEQRDVIIEDGKFTVEFTGTSATSKYYVELRCCGCSFTLSNCKVTKL